jgi:hypothetical protein
LPFLWSRIHISNAESEPAAIFILIPTVNFMLCIHWCIFRPERVACNVFSFMDAFARAVEAFWARSSTPIIREIALYSIRLIKEYLALVVSDPGDLASRSRMLIAAALSGMVFRIHEQQPAIRFRIH